MSTRRSRGAKLRTIAILAGVVLAAAVLFPTLGAQAISGDYIVATSAVHTVTPGGNQGGVAACPPGFVATGGGASLAPPENANLRLVHSAPNPLGPNPTQWVANMANEDTTNNGFFVITVVCFGK